MSIQAKLERFQWHMAADDEQQGFLAEIFMHTFLLMAMGVGGLMKGVGIGIAVAQHFLI